MSFNDKGARNGDGQAMKEMSDYAMGNLSRQLNRDPYETLRNRNEALDRLRAGDGMLDGMQNVQGEQMAQQAAQQAHSMAAAQGFNPLAQRSALQAGQQAQNQAIQQGRQWENDQIQAKLGWASQASGLQSQMAAQSMQDLSNRQNAAMQYNQAAAGQRQEDLASQRQQQTQMASAAINAAGSAAAMSDRNMKTDISPARGQDADDVLRSLGRAQGAGRMSDDERAYFGRLGPRPALDGRSLDDPRMVDDLSGLLQQVRALEGDDLSAARGAGRMSPRDAQRLDELGRSAPGYSYEYNDEAKRLGQPEGARFGPMAQDLERSELGRALVHDTPDGKMVDRNGAAMASLSLLGRVTERLDRLEGKG